jgi:alpha-galactosidase
MPKITFIGAGSAVFAREIITDLLAIDGMDTGTLALVDIDPVRLELAHRIVARIVSLAGKKWTILASADRRSVLADSDFVISCIEVAGLPNVRHDYEIPLKYGVDQCIGDTIGPGGIFKALRTGPAWLEILHDAEQLCPKALVMNYTNPMSLLTLTALRGSRMATVGLCHSIQDNTHELAEYLGIPQPELQWQCAGVNHNAWFTQLRHRGVDMYPRLRERAKDPAVYERDPVRFEMLEHFGAFVSESSGHFSEYVPYFRKRPDLIRQYCRAGYVGESGFYANNWPAWRQANDDEVQALLDGKGDIDLSRGEEYASYIVEAMALNRPARIYGNVRNTGLISNLQDGCVEVACYVDANGVQPCYFGPLPEQIAALVRSHMAVHALVSDAILNRDRQAAEYALQIDPLTAAVCSPAEIHAMFGEMWQAELDYLAPYD